jgi:hypothetical protein
MASNAEIPEIKLPGHDQQPIPGLPVQNDTDYLEQRRLSNDPVDIEQKKQQKEAETVVNEVGRKWYEDMDQGVFDEGPRQAAGGFFDALNEAWQFAGEAADWIDTRLPAPIKEASDALRGKPLSESGFGKGKPLPEIEPPKTVTGGFIRGGSQFMTAFIPAVGQMGTATAGLQTVGALTRNFPKTLAFFNATTAGAFADAVAFDPKAPNVANLYVQLVGRDGPAAEALDEYLASDPNDSNAENRLKNALAGGLIGFGIEATVRGFKGMVSELAEQVTKHRAKQVIKGKYASTPLKEIVEEEGAEALTGDRLKVVQETLAKDKLKVQSADAVHHKMKNGIKVLKDPEDYVVKKTTGTKAGTTQPPKKRGLHDKAGSTKRIAARLQEGDLAGVSDIVREQTDLNMTRMDTSDDIAKGMNTVTEEMRPVAKDYKVTFEDTQEMADLLGTSMSDVTKMFQDVVGSEFSARFLSSRHMLVDSADLLMNLSAKAADGSRLDKLEFMKHITRHKGLQAQVSGIKSEIGRILNAMKITAKGETARFNQIDDMVASLGGGDNISLMAARMNKLGAEGGHGAVARGLAPTKLGRLRDAGLEMYINGLLSKPKTQITNIMGNVSAISMSVVERAAAARGGAGGVVKGEAVAMMHGIRTGYKDAFKLGFKALKSGPSDFHVKTDYFKPQRRAISGEAFGVGGMTGQTIDFIGAVTRFPGKMLMAADDFFKTINFDMERNALAYRRATELAGDNADDFARIYDDIIAGGDEGINQSAQDFSRLQTFTNQLEQGSFSKAVQTAIGKDPTGIVKTYVPFFQTPVNLLNYVGHRTPFINRIYGTVRAQLSDPNPAVRQLAEAKIRVSGASYIALTGLAAAGAFTGAPPQDRAAAARAKDSGWRPYALRTPGGYIPYNRFDPIGLQIGLATDFYQAGQALSEILRDNPLGEEHEEDMWQRYSDVGQSLILSTYHNMADRHYFAGLSEFMDAVDGDGAGLKKFAKQGIKMTPPLSFYSGLRRGVRDAVDPLVYDTDQRDFFEETLNELYNEIPGVVGGNEAQFDLLGEPKTRLAPEGSLAWRAFDSLVNPFQFSERSTSFLLNELRRLGVNSTDMKTVRTIDKVELEPAERTFFAERWGKANKAFQREMHSAQYNNLSDGRKKLMLEAAILENRKDAAADTRDKFPRIEQAKEQQLQDEQEALDRPSRVPSLIQQ